MKLLIFILLCATVQLKSQNNITSVYKDSLSTVYIEYNNQSPIVVTVEDLNREVEDITKEISDLDIRKSRLQNKKTYLLSIISTINTIEPGTFEFAGDKKTQQEDILTSWIEIILNTKPEALVNCIPDDIVARLWKKQRKEFLLGELGSNKLKKYKST